MPPPFRKIILAACVTAVVTGCAEYRPEPISAVAGAASLDERTLKSPRLHEFIGVVLPYRKSAPTSAWDLAKLTLAALYYHPDLDVARARLASARAGIVTAEADARRSGAAARFSALQAQIIGAIDAAIASYRSSVQAVATADALAAGGQQRQQEVLRSFKAGEIDRTFLVTTELEVAAIELSRFDVIVQRLQSLGALEDALQQPILAPDAKLFMFETNPRISELAR